LNIYRKLAYVIIVIILCNVIWLSITFANEQEEQTVQAESIEKPSLSAAPSDKPKASDPATGLELVSENDYLRLYLNRITTEVSVQDKRSGAWWHTNPADREQDAIAAGTNKTKLNSQLSLTFYNDAGLSTEFDNFNDSIKNGQFDIVVTDGVLRIDYTIGDMSVGIDAIPQKISKKRMDDKIIGKLQDEAVKLDVLKRFKLLKDEQVYERRDAAIQEVHLKRLMNVFEEVGYTPEDVQADNQEHGLDSGQQEEKPLFRIPMEYRLDGEQLVVKVAANEMSYPDTFVLQSIKLLEYFGAANQSKEGYMLVPDGSGALIYLNNNKLKYDPYQNNLYGVDNSRNVKDKQQLDEPSRMPVFGLKQGDEAFLAILEQGDAISSITADVSGRRHSYNTVFSSYQLVAVDELTLTGNTTTQTTPIFQQEMYKGDIQIRYGFLDGDSANYSGMAGYYRDYLTKKHVMQRLTEEEDVPLFLELVGGITKKTSFLGIQYQTLQPLTTYAQAQRIVDQLLQEDINHIKLRYTGWFNKGINHKPPTDITIDHKLGGKSGFIELANYLKERGIGFYPDVAFMNVYEDTFGFSKSKDAARFINHKPAMLYPYLLSTYRGNDSAKPYYVLSPRKIQSYVDSFLEDYRSYNVEGLSLRDMGNEINADYQDSNVIDRQEAAVIIKEQTKTIHEDVNDLLVVGGNAQVLPYVRNIVYAPLTSSHFSIADESIPFYEMVIHGYIDYSGVPLNVDDHQNSRRHILKILETGANLHAQWFYEPAYEVKETQFNYMYSSHYGDWLDETIALYKEVNKVMGDLRTRLIVEHRKLAEGVYETIYENKVSIIVNYNKEPVTVQGIEIDAESYARKGAGADE
jgi:hypothetical protein